MNEVAPADGTAKTRTVHTSLSLAASIAILPPVAAIETCRARRRNSIAKTPRYVEGRLPNPGKPLEVSVDDVSVDDVVDRLQEIATAGTRP